MSTSVNSSSVSLAQYIDHTLLRKDATEQEILKACIEAIEFNFKGLCVEPKWLKTVAPRLKAAGVLLVTVISFPEGTDTSQKKRDDAMAAVQWGADEIDMVMDREKLKSKDYAAVYHDVRGVVEAVLGVPVKVILETSELSLIEKSIACALCKAAGAKFVKTSTGFSKSGATVEDVRLMRETVGEEMGVKASGGVRTYEDAVKMIEAGASRLGTSAGISIVKHVSEGTGSY